MLYVWTIQNTIMSYSCLTILSKFSRDTRWAGHRGVFRSSWIRGWVTTVLSCMYINTRLKDRNVHWINSVLHLQVAWFCFIIFNVLCTHFNYLDLSVVGPAIHHQQLTHEADSPESNCRLRASSVAGYPGGTSWCDNPRMSLPLDTSCVEKGKKGLNKTRELSWIIIFHRYVIFT